MNIILNNFNIKGNVIFCKPYGSGHINKTFEIKTDEGRHYVLQQINTHVFKNVEMLMNNILLVTNHLSSVKTADIKVLRLIETADGKHHYKDAHGNYWRIFKFIENSVCLDRAQTPEDFYQSAVAFGNFQKMMANFDADLLGETIPSFHDTTMRFGYLHEAINANEANKRESVLSEIKFALDREQEAATLVNMQKEGKLPLRVTHNDTKLNNVMLHETTRRPLCVIDLDCVMPGLLGNDFGDAIRFGASTADEDEQNLDKVELSLELYESFVRGFMETCGNTMTELEIQTLPLAAKLITLECGIRFLSDHLNGDKYFHTARKNHNLDRARTQFKLVADMENKFEAMNKIIDKYRV